MNIGFGTEAWSLAFPDGWHARHDADCATLKSDGAIGALQISATFTESDARDQDLRDFVADDIAAGAGARTIDAGDFVGIEIAFADGERFCRQWRWRRGKGPEPKNTIQLGRIHHLVGDEWLFAAAASPGAILRHLANLRAQ